MKMFEPGDRVKILDKTVLMSLEQRVSDVKGGENMAAGHSFKAGDIVKPKENAGNLGCGNLTDAFYEGKAHYIRVLTPADYPYLKPYEVLDENMQLLAKEDWEENYEEEEQSKYCCSLYPEKLELVDATAQKTMARKLVTLTSEQEEGLSADNKALLQVGYISNDLRPTQAGFTALQEFLFTQNKAALAKNAAAEIAEVQAEEKKAEPTK